MENESDNKVNELKERLDRGEYAVDPSAVAEAILRRSRDLALLRSDCQIRRHEQPARRPDQSRCSYPTSGPDAPTKLTVGFPWTTRPIHVIDVAGAALRNVVSTTVRVLAGAQMQSS